MPDIQVLHEVGEFELQQPAKLTEAEKEVAMRQLNPGEPSKKNPGEPSK